MPKATILGELGLPRVFFNTIPVSGLDFGVARDRTLIKYVRSLKMVTQLFCLLAVVF